MSFGDFIQAASVVVASAVAVYGVNSWRREHIGKRRLETAEEMLALVYEAADAIRAIRSPLAFGNEGSSRKRGDRESEDERQAYDRAYVAMERYKAYSELFASLRKLKYRARAQLGPEAAEPAELAERVMQKIWAASHILARLWVDAARGITLSESSLDVMRRQEAIFWETGEDDDPIVPLVESMVSRAEAITKPIIDAAVDTRLIAWHRLPFE